MKVPYYLGIDIGATRLKTGIVTRGGKLVAKEEFETGKITGPAHFLEVSEDMIDRLLKANAIERQHVGGIGVGAPGWVDHFRGIVRELTNVPGWQDVPVAEQLERITGLKSFVDNDANVMAVGELIHGAGRGYRNFVCLTLGTGVGGAIVINGEIYRGASGLAGEIGHMYIDMNGPQCACGARGCLERYVGNRFIVAEALKRLEERSVSARESILLNMADNQLEKMTPKLLAEAAAKGDELALEIWRETGHHLGVALAVLINLLNPECFIIGGGMAKAGAILFDKMHSTMELLAMNQLGRTTSLLQAQLGEDAGIIGAATFAMGCVEKS
ncbi:MAG: ROK family protein [Candidatus Hydrogenedentota bacterium]|nr:MAG: ROK family protein [Candidatus Hydrogenedentota bacterium]